MNPKLRLEPVTDKNGLARFHRLGDRVYENQPCHRSTEEDVCRMLVERKSCYLENARLESFLVTDGEKDFGRFSLIADSRLPGYVQAGFVEFLPEITDMGRWLRPAARDFAPTAPRLVAGLNAHLNYGAGFLASDFDKPPVFALPYTPERYLSAFPGLEKREMVSYRFPTAGFLDADFDRFRARLSPNISFRYLDKKQLRRDGAVYTHLNNACFQNHPYWADRRAEEDYELFRPFRFFLDPENLIFAYDGDKPVGFLLWYPDFNQLVPQGNPLGLGSLLRYRLADPIDAIRFTEVAVLPEYAGRPVVLAMIMAMLEPVRKRGYQWVEGGFIFKENLASMNMALRFIQRTCGGQAPDIRNYAVFEGPLNPGTADG